MTIPTELLRCTKTHVAAGERFMAAHGYPDCPAHKEKHEKMARKMKELHEQSRRGIISSPIRITNFLKDGLGKHIRDTDRPHGPYRTARGVR